MNDECNVVEQVRASCRNSLGDHLIVIVILKTTAEISLSEITLRRDLGHLRRQ
jgi:hypothetical protein